MAGENMQPAAYMYTYHGNEWWRPKFEIPADRWKYNFAKQHWREQELFTADQVAAKIRDGFDPRHPVAQNLIGRNARLSIALDIVRDILADDCEPTPITAEHWEPIHDQVQSVVRERDELREEVERLRDELETERMRVVACGVIALSNTRESAGRQRKMHQKYRCASVIDVERAVDREMDLHEEVERLRAALDALGVAIADAGYTWTPEMRAAYEEGEK